MKDEIFNTPGSGQKPFEFNAQVAEVFDDMVARSVPFYKEVLQMSAELAREFYQSDTQIYDLGCSTGAIVPLLEKEFAQIAFSYVGIDSSSEMIARASSGNDRDRGGRLKVTPTVAHKINFTVGDITNAGFSSASVFIANYTFQFLKPLARRSLLRKIYETLAPGGCLIISEKCLEDSSDMSRVFADRHHALKERQGYSKLEIAEKRDALENVLIPLRVNENIALLEDAGFRPVSIFFKCYNFASFIALKA